MWACTARFGMIPATVALTALCLFAPDASARSSKHSEGQHIYVPTSEPMTGLTTVAYSPSNSGVYLGSPSIVGPLTNGTLLISHDTFFGGNTTHIVGSEDGGRSWKQRSKVSHQYWSSLFQIKGRVYLMGTTNDSRSAGIAISESLDEGHTWQHSVVKRAPENCTFATGPVAIVEKGGFIFRAMEMWCNVYQWPQSYQSLVLGASIGSNLTDPESWALSPAQGFKESFIPSWMPRPVISGGFLEGNAVPMRGGGLGVLLRCRVYDVTQRSYTLQHACLFEVDNWRALGGGAGADTSDVNLVWQGFVDMPGGGNKFTVRYDEPSDLYLALSNPSIDRYGKNPDARNILTLIYSRDLLSWRIAATVDMPDDGLPWDASLMQTSFMYVDWRVDGDDLLLAIRTAFDGARSFHDSNYITFKRLDKFRALLPPRAQPVEQSVA